MIPFSQNRLLSNKKKQKTDDAKEYHALTSCSLKYKRRCIACTF